MPKDYDMNGEPLIGAGAVYWHERPKKAYINDFLPDVTNFYAVVKKGKLGTIYTKMGVTITNSEPCQRSNITVC